MRLVLRSGCVQIGTTKGTGGDVLILEEAAYCDEGFFYETVAPILSVGTASLVAISTLTSEINFYTRLIKMRDPSTGRPLFTTRCIELVCEKCKEDGKSEDCVSARPPRRCPTPPCCPPSVGASSPAAAPPLALCLSRTGSPRSPAARPPRRTSSPGAASAQSRARAARACAARASPSCRPRMPACRAPACLAFTNADSLFFQVHMLHLVPQWQSAERHRKLKVMMQDRPDLIKSELAGLAFDSLQQVFRKIDIDAMFSAQALPFLKDQEVFVVIDPAAGGPSSDYAVVSLVRQRGIVTVIGVDTLSGCKEPSKQFALVERHIRRISSTPLLQFSQIIIMCERNLGFEAEHHERALRGIPHARHRIDHAAKRYGVLTTEETKHGMCTITNTMLREQRLNILKPLLSEDPEASARRLYEQLTIYSLQFKEAVNVFSKTRAALSGKVGGMKDDVVIAMQLGIYYSSDPNMYK